MEKIAVVFDEETTQGENVVHISMSGEPRAMRKKLQQIVDEFDSQYGKPIQGVVSQFGVVSHVITPKWHGQEF